MGNHRHYRRLISFIAGIVILTAFAIVSPASAQTRIISLSGDLDFGQIPLRTSSQRTLTISNAGNSVLTISNLDYPPEPVSVQVNFNGNFSGPIAPGESQDVVITFTPIGTAFLGSNDLNFQGYLFVESDATDGTNSILMSGVGTWPPPSRLLSLATNLDFGSVPIGSFQSLPLALTNSGTAAITISNITLPDGFGSVLSDSYRSGLAPLTIEAGGTTNIYVWFNPTTVTNYGGLATITSDSTEPVLVVITYGGNFTNSLLGTSQFAVSGTGIYPSGKSIGLFMPTNNPAFDNSGYFTANCNTKGKVRATITLAGKNYPFSAQMTPSGAVSASIARKHLPNLNVSLQFGSPNFNRGWIGTIDDGAWTADLMAVPAILLTKNSLRVVPPGKYTVNIAGSTNALDAPTAPGTGTLDIKISNITHVRGILGDGTKYSQDTILYGGSVPFYAQLYGHRGAILGWISFNRFSTSPPPVILPPIVQVPLTNLPPRTNIPPIVILPPVVIQPIPPISWPQPTNTPLPIIIQQRSVEIETRILGTVYWFKSAGIDPDYPEGFSFQTTVTGSVP